MTSKNSPKTRHFKQQQTNGQKSCKGSTKIHSTLGKKYHFSDQKYHLNNFSEKCIEERSRLLGSFHQKIYIFFVSSNGIISSFFSANSKTDPLAINVLCAINLHELILDCVGICVGLIFGRCRRRLLLQQISLQGLNF